MRHLSDDEIQAYLDGRPEDLEPELRHHLKTCVMCRKAVRAYQALYADLADDTGLKAPADLAATVIRRLDLLPSRRALSIPADIMLVAGAVACLVIVAVTFLDLSPLTGALSAMRSPLESARDFVGGLNHTLTLTVAGLAILAFTGVFDAIVPLRRPSSHKG